LVAALVFLLFFGRLAVETDVSEESGDWETGRLFLRFFFCDSPSFTVSSDGENWEAEEDGDSGLATDGLGVGGRYELGSGDEERTGVWN
jgi:hypothetical protein